MRWEEKRDPSKSALEFSSLLSSSSSSFHYNLQHFRTSVAFFLCSTPSSDSAVFYKSAISHCFHIFNFFPLNLWSLYFPFRLSLFLSPFYSLYQLNTDEPRTAPLPHPLLSKRSPMRTNMQQTPAHICLTFEQCDYPSSVLFICFLLHSVLYLLWGPLALFQITSLIASPIY